MSDIYREAAAVTATRAKAILQEKGWCQGFAHNAVGQCCLVGAIDDALLRHGSAADALLFNTLRQVTGRSVAAWNDAPGRTVEDVYALLDKAREALLKEAGE